MSHSFRKHSIFGWATTKSEKQEKRLANRKLRRLSKEKIRGGEENLPVLREISNIWNFAKDGKQFWDGDKKFLRK